MPRDFSNTECTGAIGRGRHTLGAGREICVYTRFSDQVFELWLLEHRPLNIDIG